MYGLLTKRRVRMAGYRPSAFSACLWTETESKKNEVNIQQAWSIKDLLYGKHYLSAGNSG